MSAALRTRWVTFDCFGTLIDWRTAFVRTLAPFAGDRAAALLDAYHVSERLVQRETPHRAYKDVVTVSLLRAAAEQGVSLSRADAGALLRSWGSMPLFDDVEGMLAELRAQGYSLAVLTNCDDDLFELTHRTFRTPFDLFVTAERVRGYKPAYWHFRGFELLTGVGRSDWVHVASSWYHDIAPAHAMRINRVWLDREGTGEDAALASAHVRSAAEVVTAVRALSAAPSGS